MHGQPHIRFTTEIAYNFIHHSVDKEVLKGLVIIKIEKVRK